MDTRAMKKAARFCGFKTTLEWRKWLRNTYGQTVWERKQKRWLTSSLAA